MTFSSSARTTLANSEKLIVNNAKAKNNFFIIIRLFYLIKLELSTLQDIYQSVHVLLNLYHSCVYEDPFGAAKRLAGVED
ncbi:MAG: hypothetical protein UU16_C0040G0001 [Candidatus Woesebacteria bacterium GW2011_GWA2_40_7]|uniref:Uncharacterized protein n=1 Tax=Candidatus Woesebacteria bacterium GW2011_GWA2_40_7 TaxID=1618562 RepID=A0A0G0T5V9_9BACT|nr:MAG: hypothetical protein UU16_C0040G0001 [Candidatus Woesebacteria bacterium GW2011_GWA2_40_7]